MRRLDDNKNFFIETRVSICGPCLMDSYQIKINYGEGVLITVLVEIIIGVSNEVRELNENASSYVCCLKYKFVCG